MPNAEDYRRQAVKALQDSDEMPDRESRMEAYAEAAACAAIASAAEVARLADEMGHLRRSVDMLVENTRDLGSAP